MTFALQDANKHDDVPGPGHGFADIFDTQGNLLSRLPRLTQMNSPWAVVIAPATGFGGSSGDTLIGQFGSGAIVAIDRNNNFVGDLLDLNAEHLLIDGVWGLAFGNGTGSSPVNTLYFTAGAFGENHGILGSITCCKQGPSVGK